MSSLRLIHGPASPLYGDFALAGVVEAFTSADAEGTSMAVTGSSYGDVGGWLRTGRREDNGGSMLAVSGERSEGWRDNSQYWLVNSLLRGWKRAGSAGRIEGGLGVYAHGLELPGFVSVADYNADHLTQATDPTGRRRGSPDRRSRPIRYSSWGPVPHSRRPPGPSVRGGISTSTFRKPAKPCSRPAKGPAAGCGRPVIDRVDPDSRRIHLRRRRSNRRRGIPARSDHRPGARRCGRQRRCRLRLGFFLRALPADFGTRFGVDVGARLDVLHYGSRNWIDGGAFEEHTRAIVSPKAGVRYLLGENTSLLASLSHGFRGAPGVIEDVGRAPLQAWASEVGVDWHNDRADVQFSAFRTDVSNERIVDPVTLEITSAGTSVRQGFDGRARVRLFGVTSLTFAGT